MDKQWIKNGVIWDGSPIIVNKTIEDESGETHVEEMQVINPTEEDLVAAGYEEYVEPEEEIIERAKALKISAIDEYDQSENVNSFTIGSQEMWLTVDERQQIATQISANETIGRDFMTKWFGGVSYTFPISAWKQMLIALEVYAGDALNVTEAHKADVEALDTIEAIDAYDITAGYPEKLVFNV